MSTTATDALSPTGTRAKLARWYRELIDTNHMLYAERPLQRYLDEIATCETRLSVLETGAPSLSALFAEVAP